MHTPRNRTDHVENLEKDGLSDRGVELTHIQRSIGVCGGERRLIGSHGQRGRSRLVNRSLGEAVDGREDFGSGHGAILYGFSGGWMSRYWILFSEFGR